MKKNYTKLKDANKEEYQKILILRTFGNFLVFSSLFFIGKTFYAPVKEELRYSIDSFVQKKYVISADPQIKKIEQSSIQKGSLADILKIKPYEVLVPQDPYFSVVIPKIGANARILEANAGNEAEYLEVLKKGVAHADGTAFPGEAGKIFLFAHSTDYFFNVSTYNAVFYLLYKLDINDEVNIFYKNQRFVYKVYEKKIIDPSEVNYLIDPSDKEMLVLQTCWPPGTTLKRLLVFAKRVAE